MSLFAKVSHEFNSVLLTAFGRHIAKFFNKVLNVFSSFLVIHIKNLVKLVEFLLINERCVLFHDRLLTLFLFHGGIKLGLNNRGKLFLYLKLS